MAKDGLCMVILLRLCFIIPTTYFNPLMGAITTIKFFDYAVGSLFLLPGISIYVFIGTTTG